MKNIQQSPKRGFRMRVQIQIVFIAFLVWFGAHGLASSAENASELWDALKSGGHVALLRHALAPGTGDPPEFRLGHCSTQRNLSREGRNQAAKIGDRFRENNIVEARIFSSQWCRCLDTAKLLKLVKIEELALLNSFFRQYERRDSQTDRVLEWLKAQDLDRPLILVTHQVNITALTGIYPESGELVIIHRSDTGDIKVIGTLKTY